MREKKGNYVGRERNGVFVAHGGAGSIEDITESGRETQDDERRRRQLD